MDNEEKNQGEVSPVFIFADKMEKTDKNIQNWWQPALNLFLRLSGWVAIPVILGAFAGSWLDKRYACAPWGLLSLTGVAFVFSMIGLVYETVREYKKIEKGFAIKNEKNKNNKNA